MPTLYTDKHGRDVQDETERVKKELDHVWNPNLVVKAEGIFYQEGGEYNLFILLKSGRAFRIIHWWYDAKHGSDNLVSPLATNWEKVARKDYDPAKHLTQQFHPNY